MIWGVRSAEVELWKHRLFLSDFCVVWAPSPMLGGYIAQDPQSCPIPRGILSRLRAVP